VTDPSGLTRFVVHRTANDQVQPRVDMMGLNGIDGTLSVQSIRTGFFDFIILFLSPVRGTLADYSFCSCPLSSFSFSALFVSFTFLGSTLSAFFGSHSMGR
jgi:hypothetical protein